LNPVTPTPPSALKMIPPKNAPTMPRTISSAQPAPSLCTILLAMKPAISPKMIQARIPMDAPPD